MIQHIETAMANILRAPDLDALHTEAKTMIEILHDLRTQRTRPACIEEAMKVKPVKPSQVRPVDKEREATIAEILASIQHEPPSAADDQSTSPTHRPGALTAEEHEAILEMLDEYGIPHGDDEV